MAKNRLVIAAAGSGKTTLLVRESRKIVRQKVLITTYTEANESEIRRKFGHRIPSNVTIQTWFSFLLQQGVRPYQSVIHPYLHNKRIGFCLCDEKSGKKYDNHGNVLTFRHPATGKEQPIYWGEQHPLNYYFTTDFKAYSDKIAKFILECNARTNGEVLGRVARVYPYILIDEVQDLAGWELEILRLLFKSNANMLLVGDPRQVTYLTHHSPRYRKYRDGRIKEFVQNECNKGNEVLCEIDEHTLQRSHRNNQCICDFASALYPDYPASQPCECPECRRETTEHEGVFLVRKEDVEQYCQKYFPQQLCYEQAEPPAMNFGISKGLAFRRVLIFPTAKIEQYLRDGNPKSIETIKAKFYVALTRAESSVGIVFDYGDSDCVKGAKKYRPDRASP